MQPASSDHSAGNRSVALRRYGPVAAIAVIVVVGLVVVLSSGGDGATTTTESPTSSSTSPATTAQPGVSTTTPTTTAARPETTAAPGPVSPLPDGVMNFQTAQDLGISVDFGARCDTTTGRVKSSDFFAPPCWQPFTGDNGGATAPGVTADEITIVWWLAQDSDPILSYITSAILNDDTNADYEDTMRGLLPYYETYYETYGRKVKLVVVEGSGTIIDDISARADAVKIAEDIKPFMVWGGPSLTNAFADELHARGIPCIACGPGQPQDYYEKFDPLAYQISKGPEQLNLLVAEYMGKRLAGDPAIHAGDESMRSKTRVFGRIWIESSQASADNNAQFEAALADYGVEISESQSYVLNPATIQESASSIITRLKAAGVTSVIINGDPIAPREFTLEATAQKYFPEWIVTGSVLIDTAAFSRTYDQQQWAHAFGISNLSARVSSKEAGAFAKYRWFNGEDPAANDSIGVIDPTPGLFYAALSAVGPDLTAEHFRDALFGNPPTVSALTAPSISFGTQGRWPADIEPDYFGVDDIAEIWWDPDATGPDETGKEGTGLWRFVNGGQRYLFGEIPDGAPAAFDPDGTVTIYDTRPAAEATPTYEPLPAAG